MIIDHQLSILKVFANPPFQDIMEMIRIRTNENY